MNQFQNKWALVTGASSGIGKVFAEKLAAAGAKLILVARSEDLLNALAANLKAAHGTECLIIVKDLSITNAAKEVYAEVHDKALNVEILINNAGFGTFGQLHTQDLARNQQLLMLNVVALTALTHLFLVDMVANKSGIIINISSLAGILPIPNFSVYGASKAYAYYFTKALWSEYRHKGIQFLAVCPGSTNTNFHTVAKMSPMQQLVEADLVVEQALKALKQKKMVVVCGPIRNKIIAQIRRLFSQKVLAKIIGNKT